MGKKKRAKIVVSEEEEEAKEVSSLFDDLDKHELLSLINSTENIEEIISLTALKDPVLRVKAVQRLCPCRVGKDVELFWQTIFSLAEDPDPKVRY